MAKDQMMAHTDTPESPWYVVNADNKKRARLTCIRRLLNKIPDQDIERHYRTPQAHPSVHGSRMGRSLSFWLASASLTNCSFFGSHVSFRLTRVAMSLR